MGELPSDCSHISRLIKMVSHWAECIPHSPVGVLEDSTRVILAPWASTPGQATCGTWKGVHVVQCEFLH